MKGDAHVCGRDGEEVDNLNTRQSQGKNEVF